MVSVGPIEPIRWVSGGALSITVYSARPCNKGWAEPMWLMCRSMFGSHAIQGNPTRQQFGRLSEHITLLGLNPILSWADMITHQWGEFEIEVSKKDWALSLIHS